MDAAYACPDGINGKKGYFSDHLITYRTVTYVDWNGDELYVEQVADGKDAKGPDTDPERPGYIFTGWDKPLTNITSDLTVYATYETGVFTVTIDEVEHGEILLLDDDIDLTNVPVGTTLHFQASPEQGYELESWIHYDEENGLTVTQDTVVSATFRIKTFTVTLEAAEHGHIEVDNDDIDLEHVPYGTVLYLIPVPDPGYDFSGWIDYDPDEGLKVTEDVSVSAAFKEMSITVTFLDINGDPIGEPQELTYGEDAVAPEAPEVEGYDFTGWDADYTHVTEDLVIQALYIEKTFTVTFLDRNGDILGDPQTVKYGEAAVAPEAPEVEGYTFTGWSKDFSSVTSNLMVIAQYEKKTETDLNDLPTDNLTGKKVINNGTLYILRNGNTYTLQGTKLQ